MFKQELLLTEAGFVRRTVTDDLLTGAEEAIAKAMNRTPKIIPFIGTNPLGGAMHFRASEGEHAIASQIPILNLTTRFTPVGPEGSVYLIPTFGESVGSVEFAAKWTPPDFMRLWFVTIDPTVYQSGVDGLCHLVFNRFDKTGIWRLPLPNTYDDGRICTGADQKAWANLYRRGDLDEHRTAIGFHLGSLTRFMATVWNSDLPPSQDDADQVFRFDLDGKQIPGLPTVASIDSACRAVSHTSLNWLAAAKGFDAP